MPIFNMVGGGGSSVLTGDAAVGEVLASKTFYSNDPNSKLTGTMVNRGEVDTDITAVAQAVTIAAGYHNGSGTVQIAAADQAKLIAGNIKSGVTVLGVAGDSNVVDTTSGDAVAADITAGKIAWVDGSEVTGTSTFDADTSDGTAVANSLLYCDTAYVNGAKLTGTGAYWQYKKTWASMFDGVTELSGHLYFYSPGCISPSLAFRGCTNITQLTLIFNSGSCVSYNQMFYNCTSLHTITNPIDMTAATANSNMFYNCSELVNVLFTVSTIKIYISFSNSPLLSTASLLSIANGLDAGAAPKTLAMHATSKTNMNAINVDVNAGVATIGTTKTLTAFITDDKGWTIA